MHKNVGTIGLSLMFLAAFASTATADDRATGSASEVVSMTQLANVPGHSLTAVAVELAPGVVSPSHTHAGFVFVYVLEGTVRSQLNQGEAVDYVAGESWVEPPGTVHTLTQNPSMTEATKILAVFVAKDGEKLTHVEEDN